MATPPSSQSSTKSGSSFRQRLGYYLVGVAVGCLLAGMIYSQRKAARQAAMQPTSPQPAATAPATTPTPAPASPR